MVMLLAVLRRDGDHAGLPAVAGLHVRREALDYDHHMRWQSFCLQLHFLLSGCGLANPSVAISLEFVWHVHNTFLAFHAT